MKILVAPYWNLNNSNNGASKLSEFILVAPYWNLNEKRISDCINLEIHISSSILEFKCINLGTLKKKQ